MKYTLALLSGIGLAAAQGVTSAIAPPASAPAGCKSSYNGKFEISVSRVSNKRAAHMPEKRGECGGTGTLVLTLSNGQLMDAQGRTGYIASNRQFQFDKPPQAGAIYTAGFSMCSDYALALGDSKTFYQCKSGSFWNLYDRNWAPQCEPVQLTAMPCGSGAGAPGVASQGGDGQPVATSLMTTTIVGPLSDGQPQVKTTVVPIPMCQITDGQVQAHQTPCASVTSKPAPVSQYTDGQPQATTPAAPVSQYTDGQPQATKPAGPPVSESTEGQPQVTATGPPVSESTEGQPQVTATGPPVSESTEGQPQVTATGPPVSQYTDGQPQVTSSRAAAGGSGNSTMLTSAIMSSASRAAASSSPAAVTSAHVASGAGPVGMSSLGAFIVGLVGAVWAL